MNKKDELQTIEEKISQIIADREADLNRLRNKLAEQKARKEAETKKQNEAEVSGRFDDYKAARNEIRDAEDNIGFLESRIAFIVARKDIDQNETKAIESELLALQTEYNKSFVPEAMEKYKALRDSVQAFREKYDRINNNLDKLKNYLNTGSGVTFETPWQFGNFERFINNFTNAEIYQSRIFQ